jgi:hypothetical protein
VLTLRSLSSAQTLLPVSLADGADALRPALAMVRHRFRVGMPILAVMDGAKAPIVPRRRMPSCECRSDLRLPSRRHQRIERHHRARRDLPAEIPLMHVLLCASGPRRPLHRTDRPAEDSSQSIQRFALNLSRRHDQRTASARPVCPRIHSPLKRTFALEETGDPVNLRDGYHARLFYYSFKLRLLRGHWWPRSSATGGTVRRFPSTRSLSAARLRPTNARLAHNADIRSGDSRQDAPTRFYRDGTSRTGSRLFFALQLVVVGVYVVLHLFN